MPTPIRWQVPTELSAAEQRVADKLRRIGKFYVFLREIREELFDEAFEAELAAAYHPRGVAPLPPALLAMVTLLQAYDQVGDAEAVVTAQVDQRWQLALGCLGASEAPFSQGALVKFRARMIAHDLDQKLLDRTVTWPNARSLEPVGPEMQSRGTSKSAVSRRFVARTTAQLAAWQSAPLDGLDLVALLIDGVHVGDHCLIVALGIAADGQKHALGIWDGSTNNATVCQGLLANLQSRGLRTDRSLLAILDGSKALRKAMRATFGEAALVQRCQVHKMRNILEYLSDRDWPWAQAILRRAYQAADPKLAQRLLVDLARRLETEYPSAAESVREGLDETLTVLTLKLSPRLRRSLATTNAAESLLSRTRHVKRNVKRWRSGQMMLRWVAAGVLEAVKGFRRVKGYADMPMLVAALRARDRQLGLTVAQEEERQIA